MKPLRVIGVGSPRGDDRVGWRAVEALRVDPRFRDRLQDHVEIQRADRPGTALLDALRDARFVLFVDALLDESEPGRLYRFATLAALACAPASSSHGFGLAESLALATVLGELPAKWSIHAVGIGRETLAEVRPAAGPLSVAVEAALPPLLSAIIADLRGQTASNRPDG